MFYSENLYYLLCSCTNPIFGKNLFLRYRPDISDISDCRIFKSTISHFSRTNWWNRLLHFDTTLQKLKVDRKFFGWTYSKMGGANLVSGLNLNVSQEWTGGINWLFACYYKFLQFKRQLKIFWGGHGQKWLWPV